MKNNSRRAFLKFFTSSLLLSKSLLANDKDSINIKIKGDLDDDLFIVKSNLSKNSMLVCKQMHNPKPYFNYAGQLVKSDNIYGVIDFKESYNLKNDEVMAIMLANEREEINPLPTLRERTHFKAVNLYCNDKIGIPSLMPEQNDVPDYPVWFTSDSERCSTFTKPKNYNYYKLWENAICGTLIVLPYTKKPIRVMLYNKDNDISKTYSNIILEKDIKRLVPDDIGFPSHILAESDGSIFDGNVYAKTDAEIRKTAAHKMVVEIGKKVIAMIDFPYPMPYPNRIYIATANN